MVTIEVSENNNGKRRFERNSKNEAVQRLHQPRGNAFSLGLCETVKGVGPVGCCVFLNFCWAEVEVDVVAPPPRTDTQRGKF